MRSIICIFLLYSCGLEPNYQPDPDSATVLDSGDPIDTADHDGTNQAPFADAGEDQQVAVFDVCYLDGSDSFDPDGDDIGYSWSFSSVPVGASPVLLNSTFVNSEFIPQISGEYLLELIVSDNELTSSDEVLITVSDIADLPVANAGPNQYAEVGDTVTLDGSSSYDPNSLNITYNWVILSAPTNSTALLAGSNSISPSLKVDKAGDFLIKLTVDNGIGNDDDTVTVHVSAGSSSDGCDCSGRIPLKQRLYLGFLLFPFLILRRSGW